MASATGTGNTTGKRGEIRILTATKDNHGKIYVRLDNGQIVTLKTFHKMFPEWIGRKTAELQEMLKIHKEVRL